MTFAYTIGLILSQSLTIYSSDTTMAPIRQATLMLDGIIRNPLDLLPGPSTLD